ncbi:L-lactate dehydrogenase [Paenibacillus sp. BIC5C1]|uniref:L-lactate dehydrogenase n=1 Tax=Paenibacillus sp. BIC5C1 TaxID=3078263 RepID=UPI0028E59454|nr:L-lactate dehydrogenase [Paenibacillus sp. BIC5C1]
MRNKINRVAVVGTGAVGCSYAYAMLNQGVAEELLLIDINEKRAEGEAMDLSHGIPFAPTPTKITNGHYSDCTNMDIVVITAGLPQKPGETRMELIGKNKAVMQHIVSEVMASGFNGLLLIASNPVDVLTHVAWKASGLDKSRVIGSGTTLDSARFRYLLGEYFEVDPRNVHAVIIGEHGDSELPVWSQVDIGVDPLERYLRRRNNPEDKQALQDIFEGVRDAAYEVIDRKGATFYAIGMSLTRITKAILNHENSILPLSVYLEEEDVFAGLPSIVNRGGIQQILMPELSEQEKGWLKQSIQTLKEITHGMELKTNQ